MIVLYLRYTSIYNIIQTESAQTHGFLLYLYTFCTKSKLLGLIVYIVYIKRTKLLYTEYCVLLNKS